MAKRKRTKWEFDVAPDVQARIEDMVRLLPEEFAHVDPQRVVCFRSRGSRARIYARIWSLPRIWQVALGVEAHYVIEVVPAFDRQSPEGQDHTLLHELMHIPKTFNGNLVPHKCFGREQVGCNTVGVMYKKLEQARRQAHAGEAATHADSPKPGEATNV